MSESSLHPFLRVVRARATIEDFDPTRQLDEQQVRDLIEDAIHAPSSFNIQHWRFVAVRHAADKRQLREAAYGQTHVEEAAVTFIILGDTRGIDKLPQIIEQAVESGALPERKGAAWLRMAGSIYGDEKIARDEAMRSGALAAMILMLCAEARGLATAALSGFDAARVMREFEIDERYVPVMLLAVGYPRGESGVRQPRLSVDEVLAFDRGRVF
jgi:nitroreductase